MNSEWRFTPEVSERICKHMNEDHMDAVESYVRNVDRIKSVKMTKLTTDSIEVTIEIPFENPLNSVIEARQALKDLIK